MKKHILIVTARPLQQIIGCGGTIARCAERGVTIEAVVVSNEISLYDPSETLQADRVTEVHTALGIAKTHFLDFTFNLPQARFAGLMRRLAAVITEIAASGQFDTVFLPHSSGASRSLNLTAEAMMMALSAQAVQTVYAYELPIMIGEHQSGYRARFTPNVFVDISQQLPKKLSAVAACAVLNPASSETYSQGTVEALARLRGQNAGVQAAEGFTLVRYIEP